MSSSLQVKTYCELNRNALANHEESLLRLWYLCRYVDHNQGWIALSQLNSVLPFGSQTLNILIKKGGGTYWHIGKPGILWLHSLERVALHLQTNLSHHPVFIPLSQLATLGKFTVSCFASAFVDRKSMISQTALAKLYGRTRRRYRLNGRIVQPAISSGKSRVEGK